MHYQGLYLLAVGEHERTTPTWMTKRSLNADCCIMDEHDNRNDDKLADISIPTKNEVPWHTPDSLSTASLIGGNTNGNFVEIVDLALHGSFEKVKSYLEQETLSANTIQRALDAIKGALAEGRNDLLKKKGVVLKIYSNIFYVMERARDLGECVSHSILTVEEYTKERKKILRELYEKARCIQEFQKREMPDANDLKINGNVSLLCGFSMLHAAVILSEPPVVLKIMKVGADPTVRCKKFGCCIELSSKVQQDAKSAGNQNIQDIQKEIRKILEGSFLPR